MRQLLLVLLLCLPCVAEDVESLKQELKQSREVIARLEAIMKRQERRIQELERTPTLANKDAELAKMLDHQADEFMKNHPDFKPGSPLHDALTAWIDANHEVELAKVRRDPTYNLFESGAKAVIANLTRKPAARRLPDPPQFEERAPVLPPEPPTAPLGASKFADVEGGYISCGAAYLGKICTDKFDRKSLINDFGDHSKFSDKSILNKFSDFGGALGSHSPYNKFCDEPPKVFDKDGQFRAFLTVNTFKSPRLDPDVLFGWIHAAQ